jgi:alkyldihydroxyacetonephosphate synthase
MPKLSFWGWGWEDRFPDDEARRALGAQIGALLGCAPELRAPPSIDAVKMPAPRAVVPGDIAAFATSDAGARARHAYGRSYRDIVRGFAGDFATAPDIVATPRDEEELARVLAACEKEELAAIPYGGGTSVVGGVEAELSGAVRGAVSIDMRAMGRVLEVDSVSRAARIQAGALGPSLEKDLAAHGLTLRHYPQSFEFSTLGGWIATRAGGHFATLYTHIDDLVESVRMLTPRGVLATRRFPASGAGPSPERLVLGSEGAFGVITEAWVRVRPRPVHRSSASVTFDDFFAGARAARAVAQSGLYPSNCRLIDGLEAMLNAVPVDAPPEPTVGRRSGVLLLAFESADHPTNALLERALALALAEGGRCPKGPRHVSTQPLADARGSETGGAVTEPRASASGSEETAESWRRAFLDAPYLQSALVSLGVVADTFETACTWDRFESLYAAVTAAVRGAFPDGTGVLTCRFTHVYPDGPAPYFTFLAPGEPGYELERWTRIKRAASDALEANGGTITHHHAVGRTHRPWYDRERPDLFADALRAAKHALDPAGIMNPGVLVDG